VGFLGEPPRCVQPIDARPTAFVHIDVELSALDDANPFYTSEIADFVFRRRDDGVGVYAFRTAGFNRKAILGLLELRHLGLEAVTACALGLLTQQVEQLAGVDTGEKRWGNSRG